MWYLQESEKWLDDNGIAYTLRPIKEENPTRDELATWHKKSGLPIKRFVNTSGMLYRELNLKDKIPYMTDAEIYDLLSTDGMLVKRPIIVMDDYVLTGFKEAEWAEKMK